MCLESEKRKWKLLSRVQLFATLWTIQSMEFFRPEYWSAEPFPSPGDLPNPGIEPRSPALQADSLPAEPQEKPKNPGVGSLSLLQWIFPTQGLNWGLLHCKWIHYQLSYQGCHQDKILFRLMLILQLRLLLYWLLDLIIQYTNKETHMLLYHTFILLKLL